MNKFIVAFLVFLAPSQVFAQQCNVKRGAICNNHQPVTIIKQQVVVAEQPVYQIAVPIFVPVYQFQYQPSCYAPAAHMPPQVANSYGDGPPTVGQPINSQDKIRELARALLEEMQRQTNDDSGPPVVSDGNFTSPRINTPRTTPPGVAPGLTPEQATPIAIAALQRNCASCHTGLGSKGDTIIFTQPGVLDANAPWRAMKKEIEGGRMPPKQSQFRLTADESAALRIWLSGL